MFVFVCYALLCVHSSFVIIFKRKRKLVALILLSYRCIVTVNVLCLFLNAPCVGLQCVIVVYPDHIHFLFTKIFRMCLNSQRKLALFASLIKNLQIQ